MLSFAKSFKKKCGFRLFRDYNNPREMLSVEIVDFEGRPVQTTKFVVDDPLTRFNGFKSSDFALENQIAVGVPLKPAFCSLQRNEIDSEINRVNSIEYANVSEDKD